MRPLFNQPRAVSEAKSVGMLFTPATDGRRIDSGRNHLGKNPRRPLKPCWRRIAGDGPNRSGSFSPAGLKRFRTAIGARIDRSGSAGVRWVSPDGTTTMHAIRLLTAAEQTQTMRPECPGCPGGVLGGVPLSGTPQDRHHGASTRRNHSKISKVSWVSWVIMKTIACRCGCAHMRPEDGFAKQPGHPGHLSKLTMDTALSGLLTSFSAVPDRESSPRTPQDTQDTRGCKQ